MSRRHAHPRRSTPPVRHGRVRLMIIVLAPLLVLAPLSAWAGQAVVKHHHKATHHKAAAAKVGAQKTPTAKAHGASAAATASDGAVTVAGTGWSRSFSPALSLLVNGTTAQFKSLALSFHVGAHQKATASARFRTDWVDSRALKDGPNVAQQGLSIQPMQYKLQIMHGSTPASHRANCHISGTTGHVLAFGPNIDVADGRWHTVTCVKYPDTSHGTKVVVIVDGVAGPAKWSRTPIGNVLPTGLVRLGGRTARASTDSLDGWISRLSFRLG
jgi:hypothetical protein